MYLEDRTVLLTDENVIRRVVSEEVQRALAEATSLVREQASGTMATKEVCKLLKCSRTTLHKMINDAALHPTKIGGKLLFRRAEVEAFISNH